MDQLCVCIKDWMTKYKYNSVKPTTYDRLETTYNAMLGYYISEIPTDRVGTEDIQDYMNSLVDDGYALSTIKKQFHLLSAYFRYALSKGIVSHPVCDGVELPTQSAVKKKKKEVDAYTKPEQARLLKVLWKLDRVGYGAAILMMEAGLRVGEVLALRWDDVIWERNAISINKTLIRLTNRNVMHVQDGAKTYSSNRVIPLSSNARKLLDTLFDRAQNQDGYIFGSTDGLMPISYEALRYQIEIACSESNVEYKGQHIFRHTFATNCYYKGCNVKILSKLLGHSDVTITYNTYIHLFGDALEEMRSVVG